MSGRYFLDTNIFVYCFDHGDTRKQKAADSIVKRALSDQLGLISSQVVQEFLNVAIRKFSKPMTNQEARIYLDTVLAPLWEVFPSVTLFRHTIEIQNETRFSFYDSLIVAAAVEAKCKWVYSEDLHHGQTIRGVQIQNPFLGAASTAS
jgi:predicted nucleic acid-binding protein